MSVKLVVDSACDLDVNEAKQLGIELVSIEIMFENETSGLDPSKPITP